MVPPGLGGRPALTPRGTRWRAGRWQRGCGSAAPRTAGQSWAAHSRTPRPWRRRSGSTRRGAPAGSTAQRRGAARRQRLSSAACRAKERRRGQGSWRVRAAGGAGGRWCAARLAPARRSTTHVGTHARKVPSCHAQSGKLEGQVQGHADGVAQRGDAQALRAAQHPKGHPAPHLLMRKLRLRAERRQGGACAPVSGGAGPAQGQLACQPGGTGGGPSRHSVPGTSGWPQG